MKFVLVQGDGMGDISENGQPTPLEAARTPHFDRIASAGRFGLLHTIPQGYPPGSDVGNLALFGYDPREAYTGRSPLEAAAMGVALGPHDVAFRLNLVCLDGAEAAMEGGTMADYSGGHIDSESAAELIAALKAELETEELNFYPGISYRHLLVWRNGQKAMTTTPPHDISDKPVKGHLPTGEGAEPLLRIMEASQAVFAGHPVNEARKAKGQRPITHAWLWGQGLAPQLRSFKEVFGKKGAVITAVDLIRGLAVYGGFEQIEVPGATGYLDTDYAAKGRYALEALERNDLIFIHVEAPDESGHMGNREEKIKAIEEIDAKIVGPMLEKLPQMGPFAFLITSDHATPVALKTHTPQAVPFALATSAQLQAVPPKQVKYGETDAAQGEEVTEGHTIMAQLLACTA